MKKEEEIEKIIGMYRDEIEKAKRSQRNVLTALRKAFSRVDGPAWNNSSMELNWKINRERIEILQQVVQDLEILKGKL